MTLLIVDDNAQVRRMIKSLVGDLAQVIIECDDGAEAPATFALHRPDWVLMDVMMKEVDGFAAARQIKAAFPDARIIIVTNYGDTDLREAARQAGACEYVLKDNLLDVPRILTGGGAAG